MRWLPTTLFLCGVCGTSSFLLPGSISEAGPYLQCWCHNLPTCWIPELDTVWPSRGEAGESSLPRRWTLGVPSCSLSLRCAEPFAGSGLREWAIVPCAQSGFQDMNQLIVQDLESCLQTILRMELRPLEMLAEQRLVHPNSSLKLTETNKT